jgi:hypothetical protein
VASTPAIVGSAELKVTFPSTPIPSASTRVTGIVVVKGYSTETVTGTTTRATGPGGCTATVTLPTCPPDVAVTCAVPAPTAMTVIV